MSRKGKPDLGNLLVRGLPWRGVNNSAGVEGSGAKMLKMIQEGRAMDSV